MGKKPFFPPDSQFNLVFDQFLLEWTGARLNGIVRTSGFGLVFKTILCSAFVFEVGVVTRLKNKCWSLEQQCNGVSANLGTPKSEIYIFWKGFMQFYYEKWWKLFKFFHIYNTWRCYWARIGLSKGRAGLGCSPTRTRLETFGSVKTKTKTDLER